MAKPLRWPPAHWDLQSLVLAAYYLNPELTLAQSCYDTSAAAIVTARERPNPSLSFGGGWTNSPESPLVFNFSPSLTMETAGKRGYRILEPKRQGELARLGVIETAWRIRSGVRAVALEAMLAGKELEAVSAERDARSAGIRILERRLTTGEGSRPEVDVAIVERNASEVARTAARGRVAAAQTAERSRTIGWPDPFLPRFV